MYEALFILQNFGYLLLKLFFRRANMWSADDDTYVYIFPKDKILTDKKLTLSAVLRLRLSAIRKGK